MVKFIAEIGINHNGSIKDCKKMIMLAKVSGCDYVKIQKRNPDLCVPEHQKSRRRDTPWGEMSYLEYKYYDSPASSDQNVTFLSYMEHRNYCDLKN